MRATKTSRRCRAEALERGKFNAAIATLDQNNVKSGMEPVETPVRRMAVFSGPDGNPLCIHKRKAN